MIWNPQINIVNYQFPEIVDETAMLAFSCERECLGNFVTTDVTSLYKNKFEQKIIYLQSNTDHHVSRQMNPFLMDIGFYELNGLCAAWLNDNFFLYLNDRSKNHQPPPKEFLLNLLYKTTLNPGFLSNEEYENIVLSS